VILRLLSDQGQGSSEVLSRRVNRQLWLDMVLAATGASALMAVVAGFLVLSQSARQMQRDAEGLQRQLSAGLTSYEPLYNLQRRLQTAASTREVMSALVVDQRGLVLAASNAALVGLPLPHVIQLPNQQHLRQLFAECPSTSTVLTCLTRDEVLFQGPLPWIGGDVLMTMRQYPLALETTGRYGERASLITITDVQGARIEALAFVVQVFLAGLLPLSAGCIGLMLQLRRVLIPELLRLAQIDSLSGIYNRRAFSEAAQEMLRLAQQTQRPMAMALIDVDFFKQINDTHGHDAGDQVIRQVSELLRQAVRGTDLVGRLGGDEFAILVQLPGEAATQMLERTRARIHDTPIATGDGDGDVVQVNLSVGVATTAGQAGYDLDALMGAADAALYVAKDRGRGQVANLESETQAVAGRRSDGFGYWQVGGL
jgi:diguanylate cyclase (GGDEF)-like protein